jgi:hypothetical protein
MTPSNNSPETAAFDDCVPLSRFTSQVGGGPVFYVVGRFGAE